VTFNNTTPANFFDTLATGRASSSPFVDIFQPRDPTPSDITTATAINNYAIQQKWLNTTTNALWELKNYTTNSGVLYANWILIANHALVTESLRDQTGIDVFPDPTNEINVIGDGVFIVTVGNPGTNTLTIEPTGAITQLYTENTGTATPMAGNLNVFGTNGITTSGSGNTITINGAGAAGKFNVDAHTAPGTDPVVPDGTGTVTITGGQVAAGTTTNVIRTDSLAANTYTIEVQRSQAVASTTIGDNGVSHFNSAQFTVDANGFVSILGGLGFSSIKNQVFTTTGTYTPTAGMAYCQIICVGGGGAAGGAAATDGTHVAFGGGGGAGEVGVGAFSAASIGVSQTVTIGAGGTGASGAAGGNGVTSSVGVLLNAFGGSGGNTFSTPAANGTPGGAGGTGGTGGDYHIPGGRGFFGWGSASPMLIYAGNGANGQFGEGAEGGFLGFTGSVAGKNALGFGAGGSGATNSTSEGAQPGGNGSGGIVIVQEFIIA
jgi:hypothetical protein